MRDKPFGTTLQTPDATGTDVLQHVSDSVSFGPKSGRLWARHWITDWQRLATHRPTPTRRCLVTWPEDDSGIYETSQMFLRSRRRRPLGASHTYALPDSGTWAVSPISPTHRPWVPVPPGSRRGWLNASGESSVSLTCTWTRLNPPPFSDTSLHRGLPR